MAKIKFPARWFLRFQKLLNTISELKSSPWGFLLLAYEKEKYRKPLGRYLLRLDEWEKNHNDIREILVELQIRYKERSLDQNALLWALYTIEANEQNAGMAGSVEQMVTKEELYDADLENWGEKDVVTTEVRRLHYYLTHYRLVRYQQAEVGFIKINEDVKRLLMGLDPATRITLQITRGTSQYNTVEMARHLDGVFNRLAETVGISNSDQIALYKKDHDKFKKRHGVNTQFNDFRVIEMED